MIAVIMLNDYPQFVTSIENAEKKKTELAAEYEKKNPVQGFTRYWHIKEVESDFKSLSRNCGPTTRTLQMVRSTTGPTITFK